MNNCWKCGCEIETGVECLACSPDGEDIPDLRFKPGMWRMDWKKIKTDQDMLELLESIGRLFHENSGSCAQLDPIELKRLTLMLAVNIYAPKHSRAWDLLNRFMISNGEESEP